MNLGAPELLIVFFVLGFLVCTVYGIYRAAKAGENGWLIGIIAAWLFGFGWLVGLIYLLGPDRRYRRAGGP